MGEHIKKRKEKVWKEIRYFFSQKFAKLIVFSILFSISFIFLYSAYQIHFCNIVIMKMESCHLITMFHLFKYQHVLTIKVSSTSLSVLSLWRFNILFRNIHCTCLFSLNWSVVEMGYSLDYFKILVKLEMFLLLEK